ncbi:hypothetical protein OIO90_001121 [Microbotryomycetes sp. JL221]|nr:hypothetical protein OIO90_001121 [Microbotryomycetes sp. JL221]
MFRQAWLFILANTQSIVTSLTVAAILRIRTAHALYFGLGTLVAAFSGKFGPLKVIKQPRPVGAKKFERTYGMPSTHSSAISFFGTYLSLSSLLLPLHERVTSLIPWYDSWLKPLGPGAVEPSFWQAFTRHYGQRVTRIVMAAVFSFGAGSVCWSRVRLGHHTPAQVLVGISLGSVVAITWMALWLGTTQIENLTFLDLTSVSNRIPAWADFLTTGIQEHGLVCERAFEDAIFVGMEAWKDRDVAKLKTLRRFPLVDL